MAIGRYSWWRRNTQRAVLGALALFVFCECSTDKARVTHDVQQLASHRVIVPYGRMLTYKGHYTNRDYSLQEPFKLIVYVDSTECYSCYIGSIRKWEPLLDSLWAYNDIVRVSILLSPPKSEQDFVLEKLKYSRFRYPLYIDTCNVFASSNKHIPDNKECHIFFLDENDNVILVGNPLANKKIRRMLFETLDDKRNKRQRNHHPRSCILDSASETE